MSIEFDTYSFINERVQLITDASRPLYQAEVLKDEFDEIKKPYGVRIGDCTARIAPTIGFTGVEHFDALLVLICYQRVERAEVQNRSLKRDKATALAEDLALLFFQDPEMGGRAKNSRPLSIPRTSGNTDATPYAVANLIVVINETGEIDFTNRRT